MQLLRTSGSNTLLIYHSTALVPSPSAPSSETPSPPPTWRIFSLIDTIRHLHKVLYLFCTPKLFLSSPQLLSKQFVPRFMSQSLPYILYNSFKLAGPTDIIVFLKLITGVLRFRQQINTMAMSCPIGGAFW